MSLDTLAQYHGIAKFPRSITLLAVSIMLATCSSTPTAQSKKSLGEQCAVDNECTSDLICDNYKCTPYSPTTTVTTTTTTSPAKSPSEAFSYFKSALQKNDLEGALQYISPNVQDKYRHLLSGVDLKALNVYLSSSSFSSSPSASAQNFVQHNLEIEGEEYAITFNCHYGICKITGF